MIRLQEIIIKTILPSIIGTTILIGYFYITDRLVPRENVEPCEDYFISNSDYSVFILIIAGLGSLYELTIGTLVSMKYIDARIVGKTISITGFALFFISIFLLISLINGKFPTVLIEVFSLSLALGIIIQILQWILRKFLLVNTYTQS